MAAIEVTFKKPDYLAVGCFGWGRAKTAREAFRVARANASPKLCKRSSRIIKVWRIADQIDQIAVDWFGGWQGQWAAGIDAAGEPTEKASRLVAIVKAGAKPDSVAKLPMKDLVDLKP
jgi:hypothetical protein